MMRQEIRGAYKAVRTHSRNKGMAQKAEREISAGFVIFRRTGEGPKFLLLYHGGRYWNFPKGKLEVEEGNLAAAVRETEEETGIAPEDLRIKRGFKVYERYTFLKNKKRVFKTVAFYLAETRKRHIKLSHEYHEGFGWFLYKDAQRLLKSYKDSETVLRQAYTFLRRGQETPVVERSSLRGAASDKRQRSGSNERAFGSSNPLPPRRRLS